METAITGRFPFRLSWGSSRWKPGDHPNSVFDDIPEDGLPIKTIYVDQATGKLVIKYDDGEEEEE